MKVEDLQKDYNFELIIDSNNIDEILKSINFKGDRNKIGILFVQGSKKNYDEIWYCSNIDFHYNDDVELLYQKYLGCCEID